MSKGINKVILVGNLGNDPEVRAMNNGGSAVTLSVATSESWKDKQTGEQQERTEWHRVVFFGALAGVCKEYLRKGSKIYVEGKLKTDKWTDKDGIERYTTQIVGNSLQMLDSKKDGDMPQDKRAAANEYAKASGKDARGFDMPDYPDDDIPF